MKPILLLVLLTFSLLPQQQQPEKKEPDVSVVRFTWAKENQSGMIKGAQRPGGNITPPLTDDRDFGQRRVDMRTIEKKAQSGAVPSGDTYHLRLEFKSSGPNIVRSMIWEFKPTTAPEDYEPKQYLCALKVKPKDKKILDLSTPFSPVKVVNVKARADGLKDGEVVVNRIEYENGIVWKRTDWPYSVPSSTAQKLTDGQCSVF
jgi:hypothetical protein